MPPVVLNESISLTASPGVVTAGGQLTLNWVGPSGRGCIGGGDWIAIFRVGDPDITGAANGHSDLWFVHLCGATSGTSTLSAPTQPSQYEFRFMVGDTAVARSSPVTVTASSPSPSPSGVYTVTAGPSTVGPGGQLSVSWTTSNGGHNDWIVLLKKGDPNAGYRWWTGWTEGAPSGIFTLNAPALAGQYEFRYLLDDGYDDAAVSSLVTVSAGPGPTYNRSPQ
jgi:hypothetical protein